MSETVWLTGVFTLAGQRHAELSLQPGDDQQYEQARRRLAQAGFKRVSAHEYTRAAWPLASPTTHVYLAGQVFSHLHTGRTRLQPGDALVMSKLWLDTARANGRVLVALVPPDTFGAEFEFAGDDADRAGAVMEQLAGQRRLFAGSAKATEIPN